MKTLKGWLTGGILASLLIFGATVANADPGIIYGVAAPAPTGQPCSSDNGNGGIIYGATGIIYGITGIIYGATGIIYGATGTGTCAAATPATGRTKSGLLISD